MRWSWVLAAFSVPVFAQPVLYTCAAFNKEYVVGAKLPPSGLFRRVAAGEWRHTGFNVPFLFALNFDARAAGTVYLGAGNGLIRVSAKGEKWTILTGSDVTELRDVAVDRKNPGTIYFAHTAGVRVTHDGGASFGELANGRRRRYTECVQVDAAHPGVLVAGTESGIIRSEDGGKSWRLAGAAGFQVLRIEQSPQEACWWLAATQQGGLFASHDCGRTFENQGRLGVDRNLYDIAFDPTTRRRVAVAGYGFGVAVSMDGGTTWQMRNAGLPRADATSIVFDPLQAGRIYAAIPDEAIYVSEDAGLSWVKDGLDGSRVTRMRFAPEVGR